MAGEDDHNIVLTATIAGICAGVGLWWTAIAIFGLVLFTDEA